ncbi:epoxide hydrolase [Auriculariales sp. MPI-PUGE-AT-0066]|nr:epoxide hydrolase [Auriculariales sp. MPI-PUGE-AT-0066]
MSGSSPQTVATTRSQLPVKAVIFDIGGVVVGSPFRAIAEFEKQQGLPTNYINCLITMNGEAGAFQRFERGECSLSEFYNAWNLEMNDVLRGNSAYQSYCKRRQLSLPLLPQALSINTRELFSNMMKQSRVEDEKVVQAIHGVRARGLRVIALTNNYAKEDASTASSSAEHAELGWEQGAVPSRVRQLFDDWVDSSLEGLRKPDPRFFELACKRNRVLPTECVFLDDIGANLKAAARLGMRAIHVPLGDSTMALRELEQVLGFDVMSGGQARL